MTSWKPPISLWVEPSSWSMQILKVHRADIANGVHGGKPLWSNQPQCANFKGQTRKFKLILWISFTFYRKRNMVPFNQWWMVVEWGEHLVNSFILVCSPSFFINQRVCSSLGVLHHRSRDGRTLDRSRPPRCVDSASPNRDWWLDPPGGTPPQSRNPAPDPMAVLWWITYYNMQE